MITKRPIGLLHGYLVLYFFLLAMADKSHAQQPRTLLVSLFLRAYVSG